MEPIRLHSDVYMEYFNFSNFQRTARQTTNRHYKSKDNRLISIHFNLDEEFLALKKIDTIMLPDGKNTSRHEHYTYHSKDNILSLQLIHRGTPEPFILNYDVCTTDDEYFQQSTVADKWLPTFESMQKLVALYDAVLYDVVCWDNEMLMKERERQRLKAANYDLYRKIIIGHRRK